MLDPDAAWGYTDTQDERYHVLGRSPRIRSAVARRRRTSRAAAHRSPSHAKASRPAEESQRGRSPLWWGLGGIPQPLSACFPPGTASGGTEWRRAHPDAESGRPAEPLHIVVRATRRLPARRESPERAQPSLVGAWGYPPNPFPPASRQGSERRNGVETGAP